MNLHEKSCASTLILVLHSSEVLDEFNFTIKGAQDYAVSERYQLYR